MCSWRKLTWHTAEMYCGGDCIPMIFRRVALHTCSPWGPWLGSSSLPPTYIHSCSVPALEHSPAAWAPSASQATGVPTWECWPCFICPHVDLTDWGEGIHGVTRAQKRSPLSYWQFSFCPFESFQASPQAKIKIKYSSSQCLSPSD